MNKNLKSVIIGVLVLFIYLIYNYILLGILSIFNINFASLTLITKQLISLISEFIVITIVIYIYRKDLYEAFKSLTDVKFSKYIKYWFLAIGLMIISNIIITMFTLIETSSNQEAIISTLYKAPIYTCIMSIIFAPILEELVFRLSFRKIFNSNILFIVTSGLFFGFMHVSSPNSIAEFLYIIPYSIPGVIFAYTLTKSKNIYVPIGLHFIHNTIMMLIQLFIMLH